MYILKTILLLALSFFFHLKVYEDEVGKTNLERLIWAIIILSASFGLLFI